MKKLILLATGLIAALGVYSRNPPEQWKEKAHLSFVENKGQIKDQSGNVRTDIQFKTGGNGVNVFIGNGQLHYQWYQADAMPRDIKLASQSKVTTYRMDVSLVGADPHAKVITDGQQRDFENYYTAGVPAGTIAHTYAKVTYQDIYPGIDWVFYFKKGADSKEVMKYEFVVHEGADPGQIRMKYQGATGMKLNADGSFTATTPFGTLNEEAPYSYAGALKDKQTISSNFVLEQNTLRFHTAGFKGTLTIDPTLEWGTYYGGAGFDLGTVLSCDEAGNVYVTGASWMSADIATTGSYQYTNAGDFDAFLVKFNGAGDRIWATYFGGETLDYGFGLTCDNLNNIYLGGQTMSLTGVATTGSYQATKNPAIGTDAFLVKFDSSGARIWSTYFGGPGDDYGGFCSYDSKGYVYLSGYTTSTSSMATGGSQTTYGGGANDGFLAKFDTAGNFKWSTYYGGTGDDQIEGVSNDLNGSVYIGGHTNSATGIATSGSQQPAIGGGFDDFIAKFDSAGVRQWGTYYGGSDDEFTGGFHAVACDKYNNVYLAGHTASTSGISSAGSYQDTLNGGKDAFLVRFSGTGTRIWGTYYGGSDDDYGGAISCDATGNVYWCGITHSSNNMASPGAYQTTFGGAPSDAYLAKFNNSGNRIYGTYYGGNSLDEAYAVAFDNEGNAYISGGTVSPAGIATPGSFLTTYNGGIAVFLAKFCAGAISTPVTGDDSVCAHATVTYAIAPVPGATSYAWTLPSGWSGSSDSSSITVTVGTTGGTISVQVIKCDTLVQSVPVYVYPDNPALIVENAQVLSTQNTHLTYQWFLNGQAITGATQPTFHITQNGTYKVIVTNPGGCADTSEAFMVSDFTGIYGPVAEQVSISMWPNPANDYITISASKPVQIKIMAADGKIVLDNQKTGKIDISQLAAGIYMVQFSDAHSRLLHTEKLVKMKQ